jgi:hypothetical protein
MGSSRLAMRASEEFMLTTFIAAILLAAGIAVPRGHVAVPAVTAHVHVTAFDGNGGGPPIHP